MTILDIKKYANDYLVAAVKKYGGYPSSSGAKFLPNPKLSEPEWYYPAKETIKAKEIGRQSGNYPNYSSSPESYNVPIHYPISTTSTTKTANGFKTDRTVSKEFKLNLGVTAQLPNISITGATIGFSPGASVSKDVKTTQTVDFSNTSEKTQSTNDTPPDTTQSLKCPAKTKATYTVVYFGGEPEIDDVTSVTELTGTGSGTGTDSTTGQEKFQTNVLAILEYSKEGQPGKTYVMMVTADQLALKISGYTPPPGCEGDRGKKSLIIHGTHKITLKEDFAYEILVKLDPLSGNTNNLEQKFFVYTSDQDGNLKQRIIKLESEINRDMELIINYTHDKICETD